MTELYQKNKKKPSMHPQVIGVVMLLIGIGMLAMYPEPDVFSGCEPEYRQEREQPGNVSPAASAAVQSVPQAAVSAAAVDAPGTTPPAAETFHKPELISLGEYKITFYCKCEKCCGKSDGITATGTIATSNRTIAVDPKMIPFGSRIVIDGREYIAEDTGGFKGQTIDMFVDSHQEALSRGVIREEVFMVRENK